jgi:hypothetical protein
MTCLTKIYEQQAHSWITAFSSQWGPPEDPFQPIDATRWLRLAQWQCRHSGRLRYGKNFDRCRPFTPRAYVNVTQLAIEVDLLEDRIDRVVYNPHCFATDTLRPQLEALGPGVFEVYPFNQWVGLSYERWGRPSP